MPPSEREVARDSATEGECATIKLLQFLLFSRAPSTTSENPQNSFYSFRGTPPWSPSLPEGSVFVRTTRLHRRAVPWCSRYTRNVTFRKTAQKSRPSSSSENATRDSSHLSVLENDAAWRCSEGSWAEKDVTFLHQCGGSKLPPYNVCTNIVGSRFACVFIFAGRRGRRPLRCLSKYAFSSG